MKRLELWADGRQIFRSTSITTPTKSYYQSAQNSRRSNHFVTLWRRCCCLPSIAGQFSRLAAKCFGTTKRATTEDTNGITLHLQRQGREARTTSLYSVHRPRWHAPEDSAGPGVDVSRPHDQ